MRTIMHQVLSSLDHPRPFQKWFTQLRLDFVRCTRELMAAVSVVIRGTAQNRLAKRHEGTVSLCRFITNPFC